MNLDDRLGDLTRGPVPPLPGAAAARARGRQRTWRTRTALAGAGAVVAVLAVSAGLALGGSGGPDRISQPAAATSPSVAPSQPPPSAAPTAVPSAVPAPTADLRARRDFDPATAFLLPEDASQAEQPGWALADPEPQPGPVLDPCSQGAVPQADEVVASAERGLGSRREAGGSSWQQEVYEYRGAAAARAALQAYADAVERCPSGPVQGRAPDDHRVERTLLPVRDGERLLVRERYCGPECTDIHTTYAVVVRSAFAVTVARYAVGEDGDPAQAAERLADAASFGLSGAVHQSVPILGFTSPSGRILCSVDLFGAACDTTPAFTPPPRPADCEYDWGTRISVSAAGAAFTCHSDALDAPEPAVLPYGATASNEAFRCTSREDGVRCEQVDGGAGFLVSRDRYELS